MPSEMMRGKHQVKLISKPVYHIPYRGIEYRKEMDIKIQVAFMIYPAKKGVTANAVTP
jgi:hypothetical protein